MIWYQGESDAPKEAVYRSVFGQLIKCWRELWQEQFPFLFVNVGMAVITDCGMRYDIHPKNKKLVGERLALQAEKRVYNIPVVCEGPRLLKVQLRNVNR